MSEKKARASVFFVIAIIAFVCSCILFSMTGGVSDWIGDSIYNSENATDDFGLSEFVDQSEGYSTDNDYSSSSDSSESENSDNGYDSSKFFKDLTKQNKDSSSSGSDSNSKDESDNSDKSNSDKSNSDSNNDKSDSV